MGPLPFQKLFHIHSRVEFKRVSITDAASKLNQISLIQIGEGNVNTGADKGLCHGLARDLLKRASNSEGEGTDFHRITDRHMVLKHHSLINQGIGSLSKALRRLAG